MTIKNDLKWQFERMIWNKKIQRMIWKNFGWTYFWRFFRLLEQLYNALCSQIFLKLREFKIETENKMALNLAAQKAINAPCELNTCKICMKSLSEMTTIVLHPCGHPFHRKCIETYKNQNLLMNFHNRKKCPQCSKWVIFL